MRRGSRISAPINFANYTSASVCRLFNTIIKRDDSGLWERLARNEYGLVSSSLKMRNWFGYYMRRCALVVETGVL